MGFRDSTFLRFESFFCFSLRIFSRFHPDTPILAFFDLLAFFVFRFSLLSWGILPLFPKDSRGSAKRKTPCFFGGENPCSFPKKKARVGGSGLARDSGNRAVRELGVGIPLTPDRGQNPHFLEKRVSGSKNPHFPSPLWRLEKGVFGKNPHFLWVFPCRKKGFFDRKLPFQERGKMGVFGARNPLFQEMGIRAPVWNQGNPNTKTRTSLHGYFPVAKMKGLQHLGWSARRCGQLDVSKPLEILKSCAKWDRSRFWEGDATKHFQSETPVSS